MRAMLPLEATLIVAAPLTEGIVVEPPAASQKTNIATLFCSSSSAPVSRGQNVIYEQHAAQNVLIEPSFRMTVGGFCALDAKLEAVVAGYTV